MKKRLNENVLVPGDIALTTANELISKLVRKATSSEISHAMLYVTHCSVIHADGRGVWANNTQSLLFDLEMPVFVLRLKSGLTADAARRICDHVRNIVGTEYSKTEAARAARAKDFRAFSSKQFCSRLIAQAYAAEGYQLVRDPNFCTPQELLESGLLAQIADATVKISDDEVRFWEDEENTRDVTGEALSVVLTEIRKKDRTVQAFRDIGRFVALNPQEDAWVEALLTSSGYLGCWRVHIDSHPWRFDLSLMERQTGDVRWYCEATLKGEARDDNRYTKSLAGLQYDLDRWPRKTLEALIILYRILVAQHAKRVDVATERLRRHPPGND